MAALSIEWQSVQPLAPRACSDGSTPWEMVQGRRWAIAASSGFVDRSTGSTVVLMGLARRMSLGFCPQFSASSSHCHLTIAMNGPP